ncbi:MAG: cobalamin biosynthesis protein CobQ [Pseudomonadota bacterium]
MNTPAHVLLGMALCARRDVPRTGRAAAIGSLLPDLSLYVLAGTALFVMQIPAERVFGELYFSDGWQAVFAVDNSFVVWGFAILLALLARSLPAVALTTAGLLHLALDFPLHNDDARRHFWPLTDWVFESPLSYWDSDHHAAVVAPIGLVMVLTSAAVVWNRWPNWRARLGVIIACALELWVVRQWLLFF